VNRENQVTRELPVTLTDEELLRYGSMQAANAKRIDQLDEKKKSVAKQYSAEIAEIETEQKRLAEAISKKEELRPVICAERFHAGTVELVRLDTNEVVSVRPAGRLDLDQEEIPGLGDEIPGVNESEPAPPDDGPLGNEPPVEGEVVTSSVGDACYVQAEPASAEELREMGVQVDPELGADTAPEVGAGDAAEPVVEAVDSAGEVVEIAACEEVDVGEQQLDQPVEKRKRPRGSKKARR
jgi:hypothetical protein